MRHNTYLFTGAWWPEAKGSSRVQRVSRTTLILGAIIWMGLLTSSAALGSHLTLPGVHDLSHPQRSGDQPFIRQLETINNYTPPHSLSPPDAGASLHGENSPVTSPSLNPPLDTQLDPVPSQLYQPTTPKKSELSDVLVHKDNAQGHADMGWKFLLNGRPQAAMAAYRESIRHNPNSANAHVGLGMALKSMGKLEHAKQAIQQALEINPHLSSALVHLGYLYADGHLGHSDPQAARRLFDQASQLGDPFASIALLDLQSRSTLKF